MKNKALYTFVLTLICLFSCLVKDVVIMAASNPIELNYIDITDATTTYDNHHNIARINIVASDLKGLDYKKSTITVKNKSNEEEIISLYDGKVVEINNGNYNYGDYNTSGYIDFEIVNNTIEIYIAARKANHEFLAGDSVSLDYQIYLVNSCNQSDSYSGKFINKYIDYKILDYDLSASGVELDLSFDARDSINKKMNLSIYNSDTYNINVMDYYGETNTLEFTLDQEYDFGTDITFSTLNNTSSTINIEISRVPYNIIVAEEFYEDIYLHYDDIVSKIEHELVDLSNTSYYRDNNGYYRFNKSSITFHLKPGLHLIYRVDSGMYEDFDEYAANSYFRNGERTIPLYMEEYEYTASKEETIVIDIIAGSPVFDYIQIKNNNYEFSTDKISVKNNNSFSVNVSVNENTAFKYKYINAHGDEVIKEIKVENIVSPNPFIKFNTNVDSYNVDDLGNRYLYGSISAYIEDLYFEYVDKNTGLSLAYTFSASTSNSYTIDKDNVKILYNGVETDLVLKEDIVIELPIDKLLSIEGENNDSDQSQNQDSEGETLENNDSYKTERKDVKIGVVIAIVIGSALAIGGCLFLGVWFVIKKKTWMDLLAIFKKK